MCPSHRNRANLPGMRGRLRPLGIALLVAIAAIGIAGCGGGAPAASGGPAVDRFDADRAFAELRAEVDIGPRPAGSAASLRLAARLRARLPHGAYEGVPGGLRNVTGRLPGRGAPILVGAHYDTKDIPGFVGANDGAGGAAVVLQLARELARGRRACQRELRFVMFDGEESPRGSGDFLDDGLRGSRIHAERHAAGLRAMVLVDFVADRDLRIPRESSSDAGLWSRLRAAAAEVGAQARLPRPHRPPDLRRSHPVPARRRPVDRPDRLRLPLLPHDPRHDRQGVAAEPGSGG